MRLAKIHGKRELGLHHVAIWRESTATQIDYRHNLPLDPTDVARVFDASGIQRPTNDLPRIARMLSAPALIPSAWHAGRLIGVSRSLTDYAYCSYLSGVNRLTKAAPAPPLALHTLRDAAASPAPPLPCECAPRGAIPTAPPPPPSSNGVLARAPGDDISRGFRSYAPDRVEPFLAQRRMRSSSQESGPASILESKRRLIGRQDGNRGQRREPGGRVRHRSTSDSVRHQQVLTVLEESEHTHTHQHCDREKGAFAGLAMPETIRPRPKTGPARSKVRTAMRTPLTPSR